MSESENEIFECPNCASEVKEDDEFCPNFGSLFIENVKCTNHPDVSADGVCIICALPYCSECGSENNKHFLCADHFNYEIYEGMARVFGGSPDEAHTQYIKTCLEEAGLHPFMFSRAIQNGGSWIIYTIYEAPGDSAGHMVNELKVMVPCQEVIEAEKVLQELEA